MADLPLAEAATQHADHVVTGDPGRLVDHRQTVVFGGLRRAICRWSASTCPIGARRRRLIDDRAVGQRVLVVEDALDALGGADGLVGLEREDGRLLRPHLPSDGRS